MIKNFLVVHANVIGLTGVFLVLLAYFLLQINKISAKLPPYSLINFVGSILILISLMVYWNLASVVIEIAWMTISFYGLIKSILLYHRNKRNDHSTKNIHA